MNGQTLELNLSLFRHEATNLHPMFKEHYLIGQKWNYRKKICCTSLPLASTRWVRMTSSSLCPLFYAGPSLNLCNIELFWEYQKHFGNAENRTRAAVRSENATSLLCHFKIILQPFRDPWELNIPYTLFVSGNLSKKPSYFYIFWCKDGSWNLSSLSLLLSLRVRLKSIFLFLLRGCENVFENVP